MTRHRRRQFFTDQNWMPFDVDDKFVTPQLDVENSPEICIICRAYGRRFNMTWTEQGWVHQGVCFDKLKRRLSRPEWGRFGW